jgi:hypothetical protein
MRAEPTSTIVETIGWYQVRAEAILEAGGASDQGWQ